MARNQATRQMINQTLNDLDSAHHLNRARRPRATTRYSRVSVNPTNVTPIKNKSQQIKNIKSGKTNSALSDNKSKIKSRVKSGALANVYYLKSTFSDSDVKQTKRKKYPQRANAATKIRVSTVNYNPNKRAKLLSTILIIPLIAVSVKLIDIQYLNADKYANYGLAQRSYTRIVAPERGTITDRNGNILAVSQPAWDIAVDPSLVSDDRELISELNKITVIDNDKLSVALKNKKSRFAYVAKKVDEPTAKRIQAKTLPGIIVSKSSKREYPSGVTGANLVGFVGDDLNGLGGVEYMYNKMLSGTEGKEVIERDRQGREISNDNKKIKREIPGQDIVLTIDEGMQFEAERILQEEVTATKSKGGTSIIADVKTGEILSMVSIVGGPDKATPAPVTDVNHAVADVYEPGSTNKVITIAGALESKIISPSTTFSVSDNIVFDNQNFPDAESHEPATWNAGDILRESSNVGTIMVASKLQRTRIDQYLRAFGYGKKTILNFPGEAPGILLDKKDWSDTSIATIPTGNGIAVTPLQMLSVYMTIANSGVKMDPVLIKSVIDEKGDRKDIKSTGQTQVISAQTAVQLNTMLQGVVENGTGTKAAVPGYSVAGKTGTSRKAPYIDKKYMASFAGFAPATDPRIAVIVILDEPGTAIYGGTVAAPVFSRLMSTALRVVGVSPDRPTQGLSISNTSTNPVPVVNTTPTTLPSVKPSNANSLQTNQTTND